MPIPEQEGQTAEQCFTPSIFWDSSLEIFRCRTCFQSWQANYIIRCQCSAFNDKANKYAASQVSGLRGAMAADEERLRKAASDAGIKWFGCDTPEQLAETILELREELKGLRAALEKVGNEIGRPVATWGGWQSTVDELQQLRADVARVVQSALAAPQKGKET